MTNHRLRLLARYLASECTENEKLEIEKWIDASSRNRRSFEALKTIWGLSGERTERWHSNRSLTSLRLRLKDAEGYSGTNRRESVQLYKIIPRAGAHSIGVARTLRVAAVVLMLIGTVYLAVLLKEFGEQQRTRVRKSTTSYEEISTKPGQRITLTFADGTQILLNSASSLQYSDDPIRGREFHLAGEAFFEVVHSDRRPLIVLTNDAVIRDIGTKFDVASWPDEDQTRVAVSEGLVNITPEAASRGQAVMVTRGMYSVIERGRISVPPTHTDMSQRLAWTRGLLVFRNEPIPEVFKQLWRSYGLKCVASDQSILSRTVTATFTGKQTPEEIVRIIALALNVNFNSTRDTVSFVSRKPFPRREKPINRRNRL